MKLEQIKKIAADRDSGIQHFFDKSYIGFFVEAEFGNNNIYQIQLLTVVRIVAANDQILERKPPVFKTNRYQFII